MLSISHNTKLAVETLPSKLFLMQKTSYLLPNTASKKITELKSFAGYHHKSFSLNILKKPGWH
jgi:hypothetical protein